MNAKTISISLTLAEDSLPQLKHYDPIWDQWSSDWVIGLTDGGHMYNTRLIVSRIVKDAMDRGECPLFKWQLNGFEDSGNFIAWAYPPDVRQIIKNLTKSTDHLPS
jgi:hypothetical protein